ncbi:HNH endonuclease [Temperatibacter marinus]|uniref:HNH endonuclease n=1 Tax=Temperatibacter marinus TaxID=1456591 RepID=A0AA52EFX0_9PROT|nr:HNH endonuclease [Temperatibacter marinus]WND03990.1 HNH endonuclease [Temperatibacter marinus]
MGLDFKSTEFHPHHSKAYVRREAPNLKGGCPALVLNADFRPLSYFPLSLWDWQTALKAVFLEKVQTIAEYDHEVHSPSTSLKLPSVIALREYIKQPAYPAFTRFNLFLRDKFSCQYCATPHRGEDLTFDHVIPRTYGGITSWENIVASCGPCNRRKGGRTPAEAGMNLPYPPKQPTTFELQGQGRHFPPNFCHESWRDFLYWDVELES